MTRNFSALARGCGLTHTRDVKVFVSKVMVFDKRIRDSRKLLCTKRSSNKDAQANQSPQFANESLLPRAEMRGKRIQHGGDKGFFFGGIVRRTSEASRVGD